jgi:DnaJ-class molecular chaperone
MKYTELYTILDIDTNCSFKDIKKAYYILAKQEHPDKNGDAEKFKKINNAYKILIDPNKRNNYDAFGIIDEMDNNDSINIFSSFFQDIDDDFIETSENIIINIDVSYLDIFNGIEKNIEYQRKVICNCCNGLKFKNMDKVKNCNICSGRGKLSKIGGILSFGFIEELCKICNGEGIIYDKDNLCESCLGKGYNLESNQTKININAKTENQIILKEKSHIEKDKINGDVIININIIEDERYQKNDLHLLIKEKLPFKEAISGNTFIIKYLDGSNLKLKANQIIQPKSVWMIPGKGFKHEDQIGNLYLELDLDYSNFNITDEQFNNLNKIFNNKIENEFIINKVEIE